MGNLRMVPSEGLDGTKRMMRWDFWAITEAEGILEREYGRPVNFFEGVDIKGVDARTISVLIYAALGGADIAMDLPGPRLTLAQVRSLLDTRNLEATLTEWVAAYQLGQPDPPEKSEPKKGAKRKRGKQSGKARASR